LVDGPRVERQEIKPPTPEQVGQLLDTIKGHRLEAVFTVGLALGMRRGEVSVSAGKTSTSTLERSAFARLFSGAAESTSMASEASFIL
jgi:hypothetical protein